MLPYFNPQMMVTLSRTCKQFHSFLQDERTLREIVGPPLKDALPVSAIQTWQRLATPTWTTRPIIAAALKAFDIGPWKMQMTCHGRKVLYLAGRNLANGTLRLLDLQTGFFKVLTSAGKKVTFMEVIPDDTRAFCASNNTVGLIDLERDVSLLTLTGHNAPVHYVYWAETTPDIKRIFSLSTDQTLQLWDLETRECLKTFSGHGTIRWITTDRTFWAVQNNKLRLWDPETGRCLQTLNLEVYLTCIWMTPDNKKVLLGFLNGNLELIDLETQQCLQTMTRVAPIHHLKITADGQKAVFVSPGCTLVIWDLKTGQYQEGKYQTMKGVAEITCLEITSDGKKAFTGCQQGMLREWDLQRGIELQAQPTYDSVLDRYSCAHLQVNSDGTRVISGTAAGLLKLWEFRPLLEELIAAAARAEMSWGCPSEQAIAVLPKFVQKKIHTLCQIFDNKGLPYTGLIRSLDIYHATRFLPGIQASLERAKSEPIFLAESIRRVAYLQWSIQNYIYHYLYQIKHTNGTLLAEVTYGNNLVNGALLFEDDKTSIDERIEAIIHTIKHYKEAYSGIIT
jgi:WD40 repeat protein